MRIVVMSDSHGRTDRLARVFQEQADANLYLFLGDGERDWDEVTMQFPDRKTMAVAGNCDWCSQLPPCREEIFGGKRVFFTHGHIYKVKYGLQTISYAARERGADIVMFGHTHVPLDLYDDGLTLINPGSIGHEGRFALVDVGSHGILTSLCRLKG